MRVGGASVEMPYNGPALKADGGVVLMALAAETHHFDQNQRMVILKYVRTAHSLRISPPDLELMAPEGNYNLFLVNDLGVPSVGISIHLEGQ